MDVFSSFWILVENIFHITIELYNCGLDVQPTLLSYTVSECVDAVIVKSSKATSSSIQILWFLVLNPISWAEPKTKRISSQIHYDCSAYIYKKTGLYNSVSEIESQSHRAWYNGYRCTSTLIGWIRISDLALKHTQTHQWYHTPWRERNQWQTALLGVNRNLCSLLFKGLGPKRCRSQWIASRLAVLQTANSVCSSEVWPSLTRPIGKRGLSHSGPQRTFTTTATARAKWQQGKWEELMSWNVEQAAGLAGAKWKIEIGK